MNSPEYSLALIIVAAIVALSSLMSVVLTSWLGGRQRHADKQEDWARQDAVAEQAARAAQLLVESNKALAATAAVTNGKLDVIHTLVNSSLTSALTSERDSMVRELAMMREIKAMRQAVGSGPTPVADAAAAMTEARIGELNSVLADRTKATAVAADQAKAAEDQA